MIRSLLLVAVAALPGLGAATPATPPMPDKQDPELAAQRTAFEALTERAIGTASRAVRFDWRRSKVGLGLLGSQLLELNNFHTHRVGALARFPTGDLLLELALSRAITAASFSTDLLERTPFRQYARPSRFELDLNVGYPLAEGVVTPRFRFLPAAELVLSLNVGFRYLFYPGSLSGRKFGAVAEALLSPKLWDSELENLEPLRKPGMQIDPARYGVMFGLSTEVYWQSGLFLSPRVMFSPPLISGINGGGLGWWWELNLALGWML